MLIKSDKSLAVPGDPIWRLSVAQYHQMIGAGILTDDDPVELLEGWLVAKMPKNPPHSLATQLTREALARILPAGWFVDAQEPITTADSEPEPDVAVIRGERRDYAERHPGPGEVALVVEVADATLRRDRTLKQGIYARAGIPLYWILNLTEQTLEAHHEPSESKDGFSYHQRAVYRASDAVPVILEGREIARIALRELLP